MKIVGVILAAVFCWPALIWPPIVVGHKLFSKIGSSISAGALVIEGLWPLVGLAMTQFNYPLRNA